MAAPIDERTVTRNKNFKHPVEVVRTWPDLDALGSAGARMKLDAILLKPEGATPEDLASLREDDLVVLRRMAAEPDPAWGTTHQTAAIGALAERHDAGALLLFAEQARDRGADQRVRLAAIHALGEVGGPGISGVVGELLSDKSAEIRAQAVRALAKVGTASDVSVLNALTTRDDPRVGPLAQRAAELIRARTGRGNAGGLEPDR